MNANEYMDGLGVRYGWIGADVMIEESGNDAAIERVRAIFKFTPWPSLG